MVALVLASAMIEKFGGDSLARNPAQLRRISGTGEELLSMIYPIVKYGNPVLEKRGDDITEFDTPELHKLVEDMFESMYAAKGVGLAAPQIGVGKRLAVIDITTGEDPAQKIVLINPGDRQDRRLAEERRRLPEPSDLSRAGHPAAESDRPRPGRPWQRIRDGRRGSAGARVPARDRSP